MPMILFVPVCSFHNSWLSEATLRHYHIVHVCLTMGVSTIVPLPLGSVGARRSPQAFLWPPLQSHLTTCQCVSKTLVRNSNWSSTQGLQVSKDNSANLDSLGVCVGVEFCGKGSSVFLSHWFLTLWVLLNSLQWAVLSLIPGQDVLAATTVLPHLGHLLPQCRVFPLQEGGAHRDLVLLQPPCVTRTLCSYIVLLSPGPVFLILMERVDITNISKGFETNEHLCCPLLQHLWSLILQPPLCL